MKGWIAASLILAIGAGVAFADADPIKDRRALMKANGDATKPIVPMLQGKAPVDVAVVKKALQTYADSAAKMPDLFPDSSKTGDTNALPAIWDNKADFNARFAKFGQDVAAAEAAITDEASFKTQIPGIFKNCGGCHELYRAKTP